MSRLVGGDELLRIVCTSQRGVAFCNPKDKAPSGSLRNVVPQRLAKPRTVGGELHIDVQVHL